MESKVIPAESQPGLLSLMREEQLVIQAKMGKLQEQFSDLVRQLTELDNRLVVLNNKVKDIQNNKYINLLQNDPSLSLARSGGNGDVPSTGK